MLIKHCPYAGVTFQVKNDRLVFDNSSDYLKVYNALTDASSIEIDNWDSSVKFNSLNERYKTDTIEDDYPVIGILSHMFNNKYQLQCGDTIAIIKDDDMVFITNQDENLVNKVENGTADLANSNIIVDKYSRTIMLSTSNSLTKSTYTLFSYKTDFMDDNTTRFKFKIACDGRVEIPWLSGNARAVFWIIGLRYTDGGRYKGHSGIVNHAQITFNGNIMDVDVNDMTTGWQPTSSGALYLYTATNPLGFYIIGGTVTFSASFYIVNYNTTSFNHSASFAARTYN